MFRVLIMNIRLLVIFILLLFVNFGYTQTEKQFLRAGNLAFENNQYYEAIAYFTDALKFNNQNNEVHYKVAMSYFTLKDYENASVYFEKVNISTLLL